MATLIYEIMKWVKNNQRALYDVSAAIPDLEKAISRVQRIEVEHPFSLQKLNQPELGINSEFLYVAKNRTFFLLRCIQECRAQFAPAGCAEFLDRPGLNEPALGRFYEELHALKQFDTRTRNVDTRFSDVGMEWTVSLQKESEVVSYQFKAPALPLEIGSWSLGKQLAWFSDTLESVSAQIKEFASAPAVSISKEQVEAKTDAHLAKIAEGIVASLSEETRAFVLGHSDQFLKKMQELLK